MRQGLLGLLLASLFVLAGCLAPTVAEWDESIDVERNGDGTFTFTSKLGDETVTETHAEYGCLDGEGGSDKTGKIKFEGYMSASKIYDSHGSDAKNITLASTAAVAIEAMPFKSAKNVLDGEGARVEVKDWADPVNPESGQGTVNLDDIDDETESDWFVLGLIPASENINDGMVALGEYHQAVRISGYLIEITKEVGGTMIAGGFPNNPDFNTDCVADTGTNRINRLFVLVTEIELTDSTVSIDGEDDDEYKLGDVPFLGRTGFILFFFIFGIGGGVGAYMYSSMRVSMSARNIALTLLGKEGVEKAAQVRRDVEEAKEAGMITPDQRRKEQRKQTKSPPPAKASKKKNDEDDGFGSFSIDSALSGSSDSSPVKSEFGSGSSVVASEDAKRVEKQVKSTESFVPPTSTFGSSSVPTSSSPAPTSVPSTRSPPTSVPSTRSPPARREPEVEEKPKVRRRRAVRKTEPEPEPEVEPEETKATYDDDEEEFSDFSF